MTTLDRCASLAALVITLAWSGGAHAQSAPETEARRLFDEAKTLADAGRWIEACPRLAESLRLEPNMTTEFRLADCYDRTGRKASAWTHYTAAAEAAGAVGDAKKHNYAAERAAQLEPTIDKLVIVPPGTPDVEVERDGKQLPRGAWNKPVPIDAGEHTIHVWAPKMSSFDKLVRVYGRGEVVRIVVPDLELAVPFRLDREREQANATSTKAFQVPSDAPAPRQAPSLRPWAIGFGVAGLLAVGGGLALYANSQSGESSGSCGGGCVGGVALASAGSVALILGSVLLVMDNAR